MIFYQDLVSIIQAKVQVDVIYTDLKKAFKSINHFLLMQKLENLGVINPMLSWLCTYITDKKRVKMHYYITDQIIVTSGVPQSSNLSPILFNIFINDLYNEFHYCKYLLFADDLKIYLNINTNNDCKKLQEDLKKFEAWCTRNQIKINISKCSKITFTKRKKPIVWKYTIYIIFLVQNLMLKILI
jgi:hypothetical protein